MKFRLSKQRRASLDLKAICPSLRDDPAFSADPLSNPYSVTSHESWLSPPPLGHPVLKDNKKRPTIISTPHDTNDSETDFYIVQPPNTPDIPTNLSPQHSLPPTKHNILSSTLSSMNQRISPIMSKGDRRSSMLPPSKKENKQNFLSRHQSVQSQPIKSFFSSLGKKDRRSSDLSVSPGDTVPPPQRAPHTKNLPTSAPVAPTLGHRVRTQDLDQIDELDETNPWGIRVHHDGPYEAANVQVFKRVASHTPFGNNGQYNMLALQANGQVLFNSCHYVVYLVYLCSCQTYIPPQAPTGVSLNLSPGQILPRQILVPFVQPLSMPRTLPGLHTPPRPSLMRSNEPKYVTASVDVGTGSKVHDDSPPIQETMQHFDDISFNIGMAMLEPEDNVPVPSPRVFLPPAELPEKQDSDLGNPVNLESEHCRVSSPLVSARPEPSRSQASSAGTSSNKLDVIGPAGHLRNDSDPPKYTDHVDDKGAGRHPLNETPSQEQQQPQLLSQTFQNLTVAAGTGLQQHSNEFDNRPPPNDSRSVNFFPDRSIPHPPTVNQDQHLEVAQGTHTSSSVNHGNEPDVQSSRYSTSIYSSQFQNGRKPPPRHLPKRLVMPTPLNGQPLNSSLQVGHAPQSHFQPLLHRNLPMAPIHHYGNARVENIPVLGGRKLRKRSSMIDTPGTMPVITTVSFAPPIIGFPHSATNEKGMAHLQSDKIPKRLSKRKI